MYQGLVVVEIILLLDAPIFIKKYCKELRYRGSDEIISLRQIEFPQFISELLHVVILTSLKICLPNYLSTVFALWKYPE